MGVRLYVSGRGLCSDNMQNYFGRSWDIWMYRESNMGKGKDRLRA